MVDYWVCLLARFRVILDRVTGLWPPADFRFAPEATEGLPLANWRGEPQTATYWGQVTSAASTGGSQAINPAL